MSSQSDPTLRPYENLGMAALFVLAVVAAIAVDSPAGLVIVGVPVLIVCGAIARDAAGFGHRAWVSSTWARRELSFQLFRVLFGGLGALIALAEIVAGVALFT